MKMKIHVDKLRCEGHGMCWATAPAVFRADNAGYVVVPADKLIVVPIGQEVAAEGAVGSCPENALRVEDD
jgi:ferredoxin